jgi:uncharacterized membrane protein
MNKTRLEAFSDGVIAILITIMVLELRTPQGDSWQALFPLIPVFLAYVLSFIYLGIYWNNHHHMLQATSQVDGKILWANLHLLFWLSLIPFVSNWMSESHFAKLPVGTYGFILLMAAVAYYILSRSIIAHHDANQVLREAIGKDFKGRASIVLYLAALIGAVFTIWIPISLYIFVACMWLVPDRRIEKKIGHDHP